MSWWEGEVLYLGSPGIDGLYGAFGSTVSADPDTGELDEAPSSDCGICRGGDLCAVGLKPGFLLDLILTCEFAKK
jgi:hypothetical protein